MIRNHKKKVVVFLLFISALIAVWFTFASYSKKWLNGRINVLIADLRKTGSTISYSAFDITVNPLFVQAIIQNPHVKDSRGLIDWQGKEIKIFMRPWERFTLNFTFSGDQQLLLPQFSSFPLGVLHVEGAKGMLHLTSHGEAESVVLMVDHLFSVLDNQRQPVSLQHLTVNASHISDSLNLKVSLSTQLINIEKIFNQGPREHPFTINFVADLSGFKPHLPFPKSLAEWRDGGGVLDVRLLKIDWFPILAEAEGTLTLDEGMYPLGSFSSRISGYKEALNDMVELGWIKKKKANTALFMLDLFSSSDEKGEKYLKAPITLQNKKFSVGPASLLKLQPVVE